MSNFFTSSELTKAYGGVIERTPQEAACLKQVLALPRFAKVEWPLSLFAKAYATRKTGMAGNATKKDWADRNRLYAECMAKSKSKSSPCGFLMHLEEGDLCVSDLPDISLENLIKPPYIYIIGAIGVLVVGLLVGRAIK